MYGTITHEAYPREDRLCNDARCVASILVCVAKALNPTKDPRAETFDVFGLYSCYTDVRLKVLGSYQRANAAVAVVAAELFNGAELDGEAVQQALGTTVVP